MSKYELRVINPAIHGYVPLYRRLSDFARGLSLEEASDLYQSMFVAGDLVAFLESGAAELGNYLFENIEQQRCLFVPSKEQIQEAMVSEGEPGCRIMYALGPSGAQRWERSTGADWGRFIDVSWQGEEAPGYSNTERVRHFIDLRGPLRRIEKALPDFFPPGVRIQSTERWASYSPWNALYWKVLPEAVGVRFDTVHSVPGPEISDRWGEFFHWYDEPADLWDPVPWPPFV